MRHSIDRFWATDMTTMSDGYALRKHVSTYNLDDQTSSYHRHFFVSSHFFSFCQLVGKFAFIFGVYFFSHIVLHQDTILRLDVFFLNSCSYLSWGGVCHIYFVYVLVIYGVLFLHPVLFSHFFEFFIFIET